jgi:hypothetical protein
MTTRILLSAAARLGRLGRLRGTRHDDRGGVSDETAMIGLMLVAAVAVGGIVMGLVTGAAGRLDFGF